MLEDDATALFGLDPRFLFENVEAIGARLMASGALMPGFVPPAASLLTVRAILYADRIERLPTVLILDRNVVTRMARIARDGSIGRDDPPGRPVNEQESGDTLSPRCGLSIHSHKQKSNSGELQAAEWPTLNLPGT